MEKSDSELMLDLAAGDDTALDRLMDRWGGRITAFLYQMTKNRETAADLAQETFVKLYRARSGYLSTGNFSSWLFAIAANLARNHARWRMRHPTVSLESPDESGGINFNEAVGIYQSPRQAVECTEIAHAIQEAFLRLPEELREAMTLFVNEGMGYAEIAAVAGCSKKAVETRIYRARKILREELGSYGT